MNRSQKKLFCIILLIMIWYLNKTKILIMYFVRMHLPNSSTTSWIWREINFYTEYNWFEIQSFPSPKLVDIRSSKCLICPTIYPEMWWRIVGFMPFKKVLALCEMQTALSTWPLRLLPFLYVYKRNPPKTAHHKEIFRRAIFLKYSILANKIISNPISKWMIILGGFHSRWMSFFFLLLFQSFTFSI